MHRFIWADHFSFFFLFVSLLLLRQYFFFSLWKRQCNYCNQWEPITKLWIHPFGYSYRSWRANNSNTGYFTGTFSFLLSVCLLFLKKFFQAAIESAEVDKIELLRGPDEQNIIYENHDSNSQTQNVSFNIFTWNCKKKDRHHFVFANMCEKSIARIR